MKSNDHPSLSDMNPDLSPNGTRRAPAKHFKAHYADNACVICGTKYIEHGRVLYGHCVCEDCVEYILSENESDSDTEQTDHDEDTI